MGYQALLFCPDEKTARTVTQVLTELEFTVEPCTEAFAAVKKLMGGHFDAVVVDCDNEQNAALLFKSAKNSTASQASLAVAVVEGQTGVAKAFRIGANLVLTKPINVEQAKGTLRVARGLLRKGDPGKSAPAIPATPPSAPVQAAPTISSKAVPPLGSTAPPRPIAPPSIPTPPMPAVSARIAAPAPVAQTPEPAEPDVLEINLDDETSTVAPTESTLSSVPSTLEARLASAPANLHPAALPISTPPIHASGTGAASAPAPARITPEIKSEASAGTAIEISDVIHTESRSEASAPSSFTFGGANTPVESSGGSKKVFIGVAAALIIGAGLYFAWTQFQAKSLTSAPAAQPAVTTSSVSPSNTSVSKPQPTSTATKPAPSSLPETSTSSITPEEDVNTNSGGEAAERGTSAAKNAPKGSKPGTATATKPAPESKSASENQPASQPMLIKNGSRPSDSGRAAQPDAPAPSMLGSAMVGSDSNLPNLPSNSNAPKPVLQTLNVSQGVSQGLIIKRVQPNYPATALHMRVEGAVQLIATIGKTGNITAVKVQSGEPLLAKAAQDAVKQWKYKPYLLNGEPVEIQTQVTVNFKLPR